MADENLLVLWVPINLMFYPIPCFFFFSSSFGDRLSMCSFDWPGTPCVNKGDLTEIRLPFPPSYWIICVPVSYPTSTKLQLLQM